VERWLSLRARWVVAGEGFERGGGGSGGCGGGGELYLDSLSLIVAPLNDDIRVEEEDMIYGPEGLGGGWKNNRGSYSSIISIHEAAVALAALDDILEDPFTISPTMNHICLAAQHLHNTNQFHLTRLARRHVLQVK